METTARRPARRFSDLLVWRKAHHFVIEVYGFTAGFPKSEIYGLTSQFRRASVSIAANIAEGFCKRTGAEKHRFLNISQGSLEECRYYLILARDLGYGETAELTRSLEDASRLLNAYAKAVLHADG